MSAEAVPGLDPGAVEMADPKPPTMEEQLATLRADMKKRLQEKHPEVTDAVIADWKAKFGRVAIFPIFDELYVIRPLSRKEWKDLNRMSAEGPEKKALSQDEMEEAIAARATVFPPLDPSKLRTSSFAGIPTTITNYVEVISGFNPSIGPVLL
jgi:hypothetical protein